MNKLDIHLLNKALNNKQFDGFFIQNIISENGNVLPIYTFKEKGSTIHHNISLLKDSLNYNKTFDTRGFKRKNKEIEILESFSIHSLNYGNENNIEKLLFKATLHHHSGDYLFDFSLLKKTDKLFYNFSNKSKHHLLSFNEEDNKWANFKFLDAKDDRKLYQEQMFIGFDMYGIPLYTKDKVYISNEKIYGIISYNFKEEVFVVLGDNKKEYLLGNIKKNIVLKERKLKNYIKTTDDVYSNILSAFNLIVGDNQELREVLSEAYSCLSKADVLKEMQSTIGKEIALNNFKLLKGRKHIQAECS